MDALAGSSDPRSLRVYHLAVALADRAAVIARQARCSRSLSDQLIRASESVVLNIAEGAAQLTRRRKLNAMRIAHGSTLECIAALDLVRRRDSRMDVTQTRSDAIITARMLSGLIRRLDTESV